MKYIIEIEDTFISKGDKNPVVLYRAKGFNSLVFDKEGLDKLEPLEGFLYESFDKGYWEGYNDAVNNTNKNKSEQHLALEDNMRNIENRLNRIEEYLMWEESSRENN